MYLFDYLIIFSLIIFICLIIYNYFFSDNNTNDDGLHFLDFLIKYEKKQLKYNGKKKGENMCRKIFEDIFAVPFNSIRPDFLKNPITKRNLELDGYNSTLNLAFERNGEQHYKYTPMFHRKEGDLQMQQERDIMKKELCEKNKIILITIPYTIKPKNIKSYILNELRKYPQFNIYTYKKL